MDLTKPFDGEGLIQPIKKKKNKTVLVKRFNAFELDDEARAKIASSNNIRWARYHAKHKERNEQIITRYAKGGVGVRSLAAEFGLGYNQTMNILHKAADAGVITMRKRGHTVAKGG